MSAQTVLVRRPYRSEHKQTGINNIFQSGQHNSFLPKLVNTPNIYDFVGPTSLRQQILADNHKQLQLPAVDSLDQLEQMQQLAEMSKSMQTTIKQQSVLSKFTNSQLKEITRDIRNMQNFKERKAQWQRQSERIKKESRRSQQPTLLERSRKHLQVMPNPEKDDIIKNYVTSYWQMSLRNNSLILKRHIKGHNRYNQQQMEELLQRGQGVQEIEGSMPALPVAELNKLAEGELRLCGRSKLISESGSCDPSIVSELTSRRRSVASELSGVRGDNELLKMDYDSNLRYFMDGAI